MNGLIINSEPNSTHPNTNIYATLQEFEVPTPKDFLIPDEGSSLEIESNLKLLEYFRDITYRQQLDSKLESLREVFEECSVANWDGYNAIPITEGAYHEAERLLQLLPSSLSLPEIVPEPTGGIGFEWYIGSNYVFIISVGGNNIISYAGMFGEGNDTHGTESFVDTLPPIIIEYIQRLLSRNI